MEATYVDWKRRVGGQRNRYEASVLLSRGVRVERMSIRAFGSTGSPIRVQKRGGDCWHGPFNPLANRVAHRVSHLLRLAIVAGREASTLAGYTLVAARLFSKIAKLSRPRSTPKMTGERMSKYLSILRFLVLIV